MCGGGCGSSLRPSRRCVSRRVVAQLGVHRWVAVGLLLRPRLRMPTSAERRVARVERQRLGLRRRLWWRRRVHVVLVVVVAMGQVDS